MPVLADCLMPNHFHLFERLAIDWLQAASQKAVAERLQLSWHEVHNIMDRAD